MHRISADLIRETFIQPIRFALLLDDEFPSYTQSLDSAGHSFDKARAGALFDVCRSKGWLCDVDNAVTVAERFEREKHLNQSDLLVLDFHLEPERQNDPRKSLGILQSLASSHHFNLVVIYTGADAFDVARDVAFSLGGGVPLKENDRGEVDQFLDGLNEHELDDLKGLINSEIIKGYLLSKKPGQSAGQIRASLKEHGVTGELVNSVINTLCFEYLENMMPDEVSAGRNESMRVEVGFDPTAPLWVAQGNLFAVVVNKTQNPETIPVHLQNALEAWNPSPLRVLMIHARASLEKIGTNVDARVLESSRRQAGWLLRVLLSTDEEERDRTLHDLYSRLFHRLIGFVREDVVGFGRRLIPVATEPPVTIAKRMASDNALSDEHVYHALNEYLCSEEFSDGDMTTGVVFKAMRENQLCYWVCVTPACDLVPGQNTCGWDGELAPLRPISAIRLSVTGGGMGKHLKKATQGRYIFLWHEERPLILEVADDTTRKMKLETLFLGRGGRVSSSRFDGFAISKGASGTPEMSPLEFSSVALLRSDYANKYLAESGHQRSRIGVDFISLPE